MKRHLILLGQSKRLIATQNLQRWRPRYFRFRIFRLITTTSLNAKATEIENKITSNFVNT